MTQDNHTPKNNSTNFTLDLTQEIEPQNCPTLNRTRTFSFQSPPPESAEHFCSSFLNLYALKKIGKRLTDPNVVTLNSSQKQMVQTIVQSNKNKTDQKSKFLTQRASKFLKVLWKAEKMSDYYQEKRETVKQQEKQPRYASPIHNFKKERNNHSDSFGSFFNIAVQHKTNNKMKSKSPKTNNISGLPSKKSKESHDSPQASRMRHFNSQDKQFQKIRLSPGLKKSNLKKEKEGQKKHEKSFEIDLTQNLTWKTMLTTKNFQNMLKILKQ